MICRSATLFLGLAWALQPLVQAADSSGVRANPSRVRAPSLEGAGEWLNVSGPVDLPQLRGKFVILDFWTYCCINCMHILPELKKLERAYPRELVVIGVHSAKFAGERETENIRQAILRYEIEHPVINDRNFVLWQKYEANVWPSLRIIDPEGYLIASHRGEVTFEALDAFLKPAIASYRRRGVLDTRPLRFDLEAFRQDQTPLRFPGKVLADAAGRRLFIADSGHNRIVVAGLDGQLQAVIGSGRAGRDDGSYEQATFDHPQGLALRGQQLYVADTENHLLRCVDLAAGRVATIAGNGLQARVVPKRGRTTPRGIPLASPWDLLIHQGDLLIAMAGMHQLWRMSLDEGTIGPWAGNAIEDIVDGPALSPAPYQPGFASFAQPSGLASDGQRLFVADSEGSSIRALPLAGGNVVTVVGTSRLPAERLFTFGDRDGPAGQALLQHPLGVVWWEDAIYVADTYNDKIKRIAAGDPPVLATVAGGKGEFDEPGGLSAAGGAMFVADTNHHRIAMIDLARGNAVAPLEIGGLKAPASTLNEYGLVPDPASASFPRTIVRDSQRAPQGSKIAKNGSSRPSSDEAGRGIRPPNATAKRAVGTA